MISWKVKKNYRQTEPQSEPILLWSVEVETITPFESAQDLLIELEKIYEAIETYLKIELGDA